ncbi:hypothetical protein [Sporomusa sphaeroides]|uniref:hypothetical protein n=1 Tax=Sporomusa sphaeroides TaxID=47679 RepID=UPI002BD02692|nr:hypothetical protein [Sporomusa sphaeroides]HML33832.1 hypothetical protein [Sporomusa sphaeroides]
MKFDMLVDLGDGRQWTETYNFPVKTIKGATKHAQRLIDDYNAVEKRRFGVAATCRTLISVDFAKEAAQVSNITKDTEDDTCQDCHNALQCLEWARNGYKAKCDNWDYFKKNYASGFKKIIGDETEAGAGE